MMRALLIAPLALALACGDRAGTADTTGATAAAAGATTAGTTTGSATAGSGMVDPNSATREQLTAAGVDSATATIIMNGRPWADMVAMDKAIAASVPNADQRKALYARVWRKIDINKATGEEILLIPGVGSRMRREFEEYRPYTSMEQFRREMGKYVDAAEVARLEQYVEIRP